MEFAFVSLPGSDFGAVFFSDTEALRTGAELAIEAARVAPKAPFTGVGGLAAAEADLLVTGLGKAATCIGVSRDSVALRWPMRAQAERSRDRHNVSDLPGWEELWGERRDRKEAERRARVAVSSPAKSAAPVTPALEQVRGVQLLLLAAKFVLLIIAALAGAHAFENFALTERLMVFGSRFLALAFEVANFSLEFLAQMFEILAVERCELELGGAAARRQAGGVGVKGIVEEAIELRQRILGASHGETGLAHPQSALPLDALAKTKQRRKCETESHGSQDESAIRRPMLIVHAGHFLRSLDEKVAQRRHECNGAVQIGIAVFLVGADAD